MKVTFRPKILDAAVFAAALFLVVFISLSIYSGSGNILYVHITGESGEWIEPLDSRREVEVPGPLGITHVHIENGSVSVTDSPCGNKLCIAMGSISARNQWIACLPNNVFVRISGRDSGEDLLDAASY